MSSRRRFAYTLIQLLLLLSGTLAYGEANAVEPVLRVIYGSPVGAVPTPQMYPYKLLKAALDASGQPYQLQPANADMVQSRVLREIEQGNVDVYWSATSAERETALRPIRIALDKGLNGWRLLLIRKSDQARFASIRSESTFRRLTFVQGHDWPDTALLINNGFKVLTAQHPPALFEMLLKQRVDAFPRSVIEAYREQENYPELMVEPKFVVVYPAAVYFFVNKNNEELAQRLEAGLRVIQQSGEFDRLFNERYGASIKAANLATRQVIRLDNPSIHMTEQAVLGNSNLQPAAH